MTWRYTTHCYAGLAHLALSQGDSERARRLADQSLELGVPTRSRKFETWAWRLKGESATRRGAWGEAEDALRRAQALSRGVAIITGLRASTQEPALRAGLETSPLVKEVEDLARPE